MLKRTHTCINNFDFPHQTQFEAARSFIRAKSEIDFKKEKPPLTDKWGWAPPDFRLLVWEPKPPARNSREAVRPERFFQLGTHSTNERLNVNQSDQFSINPSNEHFLENPFITRVKSIRPFTAKRLFVKYGTFKPDVYKMPKPHDHRGVSKLDGKSLCMWTLFNN